MLTSGDLNPVLTQSLGRVLEHLRDGASGVPEDLEAQLANYARLKAELGRAGVAEALGLHVAELPFLDASMRDVERTTSRLVDGDTVAERNAAIARIRLLSWLETIGQRVPALAIAPEVEALVSEDVGRKQVRALELIVRSLITESYGDQETLIARLRDALNERVVGKWASAADTGDVLSGCTFSELASLFVNKEEFARYETMYEDTPFLTLLKQRRRTIQTFLEDVRRIRNVLAHNKRVTPLQLSLLDLYYEEIVAPVQTAFDEGETKVDPTEYLDVPREVLDGYYQALREDVQSVKDDLGELKTSVMASLGALATDAAAIKDTTRAISRKVLYIGGGVAVLLALVVFLVVQGGDTQDDVEAARASTERTEETTRETAKELESLKESHEEVADLTRETAETTREVAENVAEATEEVARGADAIEEATEATREAARGMEETTERVVQTLEELRAGFQALTQQGGIIADARRPQEHYHNARTYEQRGDYGKAQQSYLAFFASQELEFVDPHLRFQAFLKLQSGVAGAREVYYELKRDSKSTATQFAWLLLLDGEARAKGLEAFLDAHPDFAPAAYALSRDYSVARLGTQSMADKRAEKKLLEKFLALKDEGGFLGHYLDQAVAAQQIEDAEERMAALSTISDAVLDNPVQISGNRSNAGWMVTVSIADTVKEIFYRLGTEGAFKSTGFIPGVHTHAGLPLAKPSIEMGNAGKTVIQVKYTDPRDREHGPFDLLFDPDVMLLESTKNILGMTKNSWIAFGTMSADRALLYFSHLLSYRAAIEEIRYGLDTDSPDRKHPFTPEDPKNPHAVSANDTIYIEIPSTTKFVTVQLKYKDGTTSEIQRFER